MKWLKIISIPIFAYLVVLWGGQSLSSILDTTAVAILAILVGLIIGAVGVLIASLSNLFNNLLSVNIKDEKTNELIIKWVNDCHRTIREVRQDVIFLVVALFSCFLFSLLRFVDIPFMKWTLQSSLITKNIILSWLSLSLLGFSFVAITDVVLTMFVINEHHEIIVKDRMLK